MIFFIIYAIGIWVAVYRLRGKWHAPAILMASISPILLATIVLLWPSFHPQSNDLLLANLGGYGRLLAVFTGAFGFMILFVGAVILATPRRVPAGCCIICRYDLTGAPTSICPECGSVESAR
ncbi:MAG: hypothetical protein H6812_05960 [Phycisphaeraceae bacterium]|nr:hypothetical protein [Phycisphaerales bacterium]MCB9842789.1 hypothetical protein [Phycisphaeraceae bacterium]